MLPQSGSSKRPICPACSKPARTCLCSRFKTSKIDNSVAITILQHSLEKNHPLNSARIAALGLKNVEIVPVCDVHVQAKFSIRVIDPDAEMSYGYIGERSDSCIKDADFIGFKKYSELGSGDIDERNDFCEKDADFRGFGKYPKMGSGDIDERNGFCDNGTSFNGFRRCCDEVIEDSIHLDGKMRLGREFEDKKVGENCLGGSQLAERTSSITLEVQECVENGEAPAKVARRYEKAAIDLTIEKYGVISSFRHYWMAKGQLKEPSFEGLIKCEEVMDDLARGFIVKKLQRKQINGSLMDDESKEFEIIIPQGTVLLFPSEEAVSFDELHCEVKNLIVLDGTWAKARRMYNENPWLKVVPHLKLDIDKLSLYNEVRQQPKARYLSTIESIVYSLKAIGDDSEGLDGLLDVFESMVGDQRRFKNERLNEELG